MEKEKTRPLAEQVTEQLINYIIEHDLKPGDKIPNEFELAAYLGVGRSTIREAVKILVSRNVVEIHRGAGTFVAKEKGMADDPLGLAFVEDKFALAQDLLSVRFMLEPEISAMAARNATKEQIRELIRQCDLVEDKIRHYLDHTAEDIRFHQMIARCSGNIVVEKLIPIINSGVIVFISLTGGRLRDETIESHREIVEAIRTRDEAGARYAMEMHLIYNRKRIQQIKAGAADITEPPY